MTGFTVLGTTGFLSDAGLLHGRRMVVFDVMDSLSDGGDYAHLGNVAE